METLRRTRHCAAAGLGSCSVYAISFGPIRTPSLPARRCECCPGRTMCGWRGVQKVVVIGQILRGGVAYRRRKSNLERCSATAYASGAFWWFGA